MFGVAPDPFLDDGAEILPEFAVAVGVLGTGFQLGQHAVGQRPADAGQHRRRLQHFAADVQRQILGIHHALDETKPFRQQLGICRDEHPPHMQAHMRFAIAVEQIERARTRNKQQGVEFHLALGAPVQRRPGFVERMAQMPIQLGVGFLLHFRFRLAPQSGAFVGRNILAVTRNGHRQRNVVRPFADDGLQPVGVEIFLRVRFQMQYDGSAGVFALPRRQRVFAAAVARPGPGVRAVGPAGGDLHPVGDHERTLKTYAELADQGRAFVGLGPLEAGGESARARAGDGAEVLREVIAAHADAIILDRQRAGRAVRNHADFGVRRGGNRGVGERFEAPAVGRVGGVGDKLAQENLALGVERVDDQVEQAPNFRAEAVTLKRGRRLGVGHGGSSNCRDCGDICRRRQEINTLYPTPGDVRV